MTKVKASYGCGCGSDMMETKEDHKKDAVCSTKKEDVAMNDKADDKITRDASSKK